jgi:hypothetical protein
MMRLDRVDYFTCSILFYFCFEHFGTWLRSNFPYEFCTPTWYFIMYNFFAFVYRTLTSTKHKPLGMWTRLKLYSPWEYLHTVENNINYSVLKYTILAYGVSEILNYILKSAIPMHKIHKPPPPNYFSQCTIPHMVPQMQTSFLFSNIMPS